MPNTEISKILPERIKTLLISKGIVLEDLLIAVKSTTQISYNIPRIWFVATPEQVFLCTTSKRKPLLAEFSVSKLARAHLTHSPFTDQIKIVIGDENKDYELSFTQNDRDLIEKALNRFSHPSTTGRED